MTRGNPGGKFSDKIVPGAIFGRLTIIRRLPKKKGKYRSIHKVLCSCECGGRATPEVCSILSGASTSCGCRKRECGAENAKARVVIGRGYGKIIPGNKFGRLTIVKRLTDRIVGKRKRPVILCRCDCGKVIIVIADDLIRGYTQSCKCLSSDVTTARNKASAKFGRFSARCPKTYSSWNSMKARCLNPNANSYSHYGGRGIKVCLGFQADPRNLVKLIGIRTKAKPSLDRYPIHNGHYSCGQCEECKRRGWKLNVRWTTKRGQAENRGSFNVYLTAFGKRKNKSYWMRRSGLSWGCLTARLRTGWPVEKALTTPDPKGNCYHPEESVG